MIKKILLPLLFVAAAHAASAQSMAITEWMYNSDEFVEFTNVSSSAIDMTGWSYDDDSRIPGSISLSDFGTVAAGQSVILSEASAADFRAHWGLSSSVKVIGNNTVNIGRADELNLFDASNTLVDRLTYGDQAIPGTIRTDTKSGWTTYDNLGDNTVGTWVLSSVGDAQHSYASTLGNIGNPGTYAIPEPSTYALLAGLGAMGVAMLRRKRAALAA